MERCVCLRGSRKQREAGEKEEEDKRLQRCQCAALVGPKQEPQVARGCGLLTELGDGAWGGRAARGRGTGNGLVCRSRSSGAVGAVDSEHALAWTGRQMPPASLALSPLSPYSSVPEGQVPAHGQSLNGRDRALPLWASCLLPSPGAQVPASLYSALQRGQHGRLILGQRWGAVQSFQAPFTHGQIKEPDTATAQPSPGAPQPLGVKGANYR